MAPDTTSTTTMQCITAPRYTSPAAYELTTLPRPEVTDANDVLIQVHAASVNPIDVKKASGALKAAFKDQFPYKIGYDCAGVVQRVGGGVTSFQEGDEVFVRLPEPSRGSLAEYVKCPDRFLALKPPALSFGDAASLPLAAMISLQALRKYRGSLEGKTVFIPAALSGTGAYACQLAKNVFSAGKVITSVSTAKVARVPELLGEGVVDQIIDYTTTSVHTSIPPQSIDFLLDTTGQAMSFLSLMVPHTSRIVSISTSPSGAQLQECQMMKRPHGLPPVQVPSWVRMTLNVTDGVRQLRAKRWGVEYGYLFLEPNGEDLRTLSGYVAEGKLRPVVGRRVDLRDLEGVREACSTVYGGKGGVGKVVVNVR
ncbi:uncharacterized protein HMPREF1541_04475 [Cyphellophora europaea CBS 101466]|uniref:Enoyl reductase (ER) domain-containing protein n=1 Tax=Cyphellophora europaea (strain CBS 101466) TaxID=1220924 RepID=W2RWX4_CYPE1|nr:uncharacterized protein HMPREF1541_04475 [Cyphellophora europaea CBS 101466]ETN40199.1 hypothetical protein HMPREF1541_04475 [Cyphellophora europaea CBS 101466]